MRFQGNTTGYKINKIMTQLCAATSATATLPPKQIWFFGDSAPRMKIPHLQCCFSNKTSKRIKFHSPSLLISDRLKSSQQKKNLNSLLYFHVLKKYTEPSNLPRYSHDYNHLTKPRLKDKHHWYWNPYDFFGVMSLAKRGSLTPGNHHHRDRWWSIRPELRHHDGCHGHRLVVKLASRQMAWD